MQLSRTVWAFATARAEALPLFDAVALEAAKKVAFFTATELAETAWAFAEAGAPAADLFDALNVEILKKIEDFNPKQLADMAWAFSATAPWDDDLDGLFVGISKQLETHVHSLETKQLAQLHRAYVALRLSAPKHALTLLLARHEHELRAADPHAAQTDLSKDVSCTLNKMNWVHEVGHVTVEGFFVDLACRESKTAIIVLEASGYTTGEPLDIDSALRRRLDGAARFQAGLLRKQGWRVVHVFDFEWKKVHRLDRASKFPKEAYLRKKLDELLNQV
mmetsp:Transcript_4933/g.17603  ORF Transcript_4933/g.17603 Transcript_4933/m.17603 type:complete len:277 (+) Transcript_4933:278-1108(+)